MNEVTKSTKPSLNSMYSRVTEIRDRIGLLSSRLKNVHEPQPVESDTKPNSLTPDCSISAINDKINSIDYYLRDCEDTLTKIVG
ncbi:MAG: hypothetical protein KGH87_08340 [Thaumarchaeota archaeon]|nr:hypothetical protein [Nitrososphaerota archaeon]